MWRAAAAPSRAVTVAAPRAPSACPIAPYSGIALGDQAAARFEVSPPCSSALQPASATSWSASIAAAVSRLNPQRRHQAAHAGVEGEAVPLAPRRLAGAGVGDHAERAAPARGRRRLGRERGVECGGGGADRVWLAAHPVAHVEREPERRSRLTTVGSCSSRRTRVRSSGRDARRAPCA